MGEVSEINIYPLKSAAQLGVEQSEVSDRGLFNDRIYMVVDTATRTWVSQRDNPKLALVQASIDVDDTLQLAFSGQQGVELSHRHVNGEAAEASLWEEPVQVIDQGDTIAEWLSARLEQSVRVVTMSPGCSRPTSDSFASGFESGLTDGFPFLLITEASIAAVNSKLTKGQVSSRNFRPNIVVKGSKPWAEDQWSIFRIGSVVFQAVKPCSRCRVTAVDPDTGVAGQIDTLAVFNKWRKGRDLGIGPWGEGQCFFGQNCVAHNDGTIKVGDAVEVLVFENWDQIVGARTDLKAEDLDASAL